MKFWNGWKVRYFRKVIAVSLSKRSEGGKKENPPSEKNQRTIGNWEGKEERKEKDTGNEP